MRKKGEPTVNIANKNGSISDRMPVGAANAPAGPRKRINRQLRAMAEALGNKGTTSPLAFVLAVMRDEERDFATRFDAAKAALPYIHPRLMAIHQSTDGSGKTHEVWVKELAEQMSMLDGPVIEGEAKVIDDEFGREPKKPLSK